MNIKTARLSKTDYDRPKKTLQDTISNEEIKEKLEGYKQVDDISKVLIGSHIRYFTKTKDSKPSFRFGGNLTKFGEEYKYIILSNGKLSWSVQNNNMNTFWVKMNQKEFKEQIESEVKETLNEDKYKEKYKQIKNQSDYVLKLLDEQKKENDKLKQKMLNIEKITKDNLEKSRKKNSKKNS
jgi:hypothetical protein